MRWVVPVVQYRSSEEPTPSDSAMCWVNDDDEIVCTIFHERDRGCWNWKRLKFLTKESAMRAVERSWGRSLGNINMFNDLSGGGE